MIRKRSCACARCASERDVNGSEDVAISNSLPILSASLDDDLPPSIPDTTRNYQEIRFILTLCGKLKGGKIEEVFSLFFPQHESSNEFSDKHIIPELP